MEIIKTLKQIPILRILIPFILGIVISNLYTINCLLLIIYVTCLFIATIFLGFVPYFNRKYSLQKIYGINISLFFLVAGTLLFNLKNRELDSANYLSSYEKDYLVTIKDLPQEKNKTFQVKANLDGVIDSLIHPESKKGVIFYFAKGDSSIKKLLPGDKLVIRTKLNLIKNKNNPDEFDYKKFINRRGYTYTAYLKENNYEILALNEHRTVESKIAEIRVSILNQLKKEFDDDTYALLSSMLIGIKDDLDEETRNSFSASGITHLLAISGLHVGILYLVLTFLLSFLGNTNTARLFQNLTIILVLWFYAMLAGLSPSVVRATIMFSVISTGKLLDRNTIIYNSLAFAALLMLVLNPNNLFEVGFQLSFLAVLGIVYFQPKFSNLVKTKNQATTYLWGLISVSIAAQLATFPLTIYYFHQFPNYFILGNLLAIPLFFMNLILGLIYILLGWIPIIGPVFQFITAFLSDLILRSSDFVSNLRFSVTEGLVLGKLQVLFIYCFLIIMAYFLSYKRGKYLLLALINLLIVISINVVNLCQKRNIKELTIYNNQTTLISYINGSHSFCFIDSTEAQDDKYKYAIKEHLIAQHAYKKQKNKWLNNNFEVDYLSMQKLEEKNKLLVFGKDKILFLNEDCIRKQEKIKIDFIVLEDDVRITMQELYDRFKFDKVVFAASNNSWNISKWKSECQTLNIDYFSIPDSGAFQLTN